MNFIPVELKAEKNLVEHMTISLSRLNDGLDYPVLNTSNNFIYVPIISKEFYENNFGEVKEIKQL